MRTGWARAGLLVQGGLLGGPAPAQATTLHWGKSTGEECVFSSQPWFPVAAVALAGHEGWGSGESASIAASQGPLGRGRSPDGAEAGGSLGLSCKTQTWKHFTDYTYRKENVDKLRTRKNFSLKGTIDRQATAWGNVCSRCN